MKTVKNFILMNALGALTLSPFALANTAQMEEDKASGKQEEQVKQEETEATKTRQVQGTILQHKTVHFFKDKKQAEQAQGGDKAVADKAMKSLVVLIKTDKGNERLALDLGKVENIPDIKDGETKIQAEGRLVELGSKQLFVAKKAKIGDKVMDITRS